MYFYGKESSRIEDNYKVYSHLGNEGICAFCGDSFNSSSCKAKAYREKKVTNLGFANIS